MRAAMLAHGFDVDPIADGKWHRFRLTDDKAWKKSGWYICDGVTGSFGDWRKPDKGKVLWGKRGSNPVDKNEYRKIIIFEPIFDSIPYDFFDVIKIFGPIFF